MDNQYEYKYLSDFLVSATLDTLTEGEMVIIVNQALIIIDDLYVHLPLKKAMYAIDPVQRLKLLKRRIRGISEPIFHKEMISIFLSLHDGHTIYCLPEPYRNLLVFLPFEIKEYFDGDIRHYLVVKTYDNLFRYENFKVGVEITHWNGVPIDKAVANNEIYTFGSNDFARHARSVQAMFIRPLMCSLPPDEEWIAVTYTDGNDSFTSVFRWIVQIAQFDPERPEDTPKAALFQGVDIETEIVNRAKKILFSPDDMEVEFKVRHFRSNNNFAPNIIKETLGDTSIIPELIPKIMPFDSPYGKFGYIRITSFQPKNGYPSPDEFVTELVRIIDSLPQDGLIIDVRSNGGGDIRNGERMLQLFTSNKVIAENFEFINTDQTLILSSNHNQKDELTSLKHWHHSIDISLFTGAVYSQGFPIEHHDLTNSVGRKYQGKVLLITDALCYSTTDMLAAGFQDNKIGMILGVDNNTGAGGANVWEHKELCDLFSGIDSLSPIKPLPKGVNMRVALRRSMRVGDNAGLPVEDVGITPDRIHKITFDDIVNNDIDLLNTAAKMLAGI